MFPRELACPFNYPGVYGKLTLLPGKLLCLEKSHTGCSKAVCVRNYIQSPSRVVTLFIFTKFSAILLSPETPIYFERPGQSLPVVAVLLFYLFARNLLGTYLLTFLLNSM